MFNTFPIDMLRAL